MTIHTNPRRLGVGAAALSLVLLTVGCDDDDDAVLDPVNSTTPVRNDTTSPTTAVSDTAAGEGATTTDDSSEEEVQVAMIDISFDPGDITVPVGAMVVWTNQDAVDHTTTADDGTWDSDAVAPGESFDFDFDEPGTYAYVCEIHTTMQGTVTVEG